jgi:molecular chaperone HtpG
MMGDVSGYDESLNPGDLVGLLPLPSFREAIIVLEYVPVVPSGAFRDPDIRGIRVRVRNIQIDETDVIRDIFAVSYRSSVNRSSYARFAEWYIGEVFVDPEAAVPNARRDGFEEDEEWHALRDELDQIICTPYGILAYRTSKGDQLSLDNLTRRYAALREQTDALITAGTANWDIVSVITAAGNEIQKRILLAVRTAEDHELTELRGLATNMGALKRDLARLGLESVPISLDCEQESAQARSDLAQSLYKEFRQRLDPAEFAKARAILHDTTGEEPV